MTAGVGRGLVEAAVAVISGSSRGPRFMERAAPPAALRAHLEPAASGGHTWPVTLRIQFLHVVAPGMPLARPALPRPGGGRRSCSGLAPAVAHRVEAEWTVMRTRRETRWGTHPADACDSCGARWRGVRSLRRVTRHRELVPDSRLRAPKRELLAFCTCAVAGTQCHGVRVGLELRALSKC